MNAPHAQTHVVERHRLALLMTLLSFGAAVLPSCAADPPPEIPGKAIGPRILTRRGVSLAGAEFGNAIPGTLGTDYFYPTHDEVDYYASKGMTEMRIPFRWERLQPTVGEAFDEAEGARLDDLVAYSLGKGVGVLLDPHNYAQYNGSVLGSGVTAASFADFWSRLATRYAGMPTIDFGLMNEPHDMNTEDWVASANAAIQAIRATGANNLITVSGNGWDKASDWYQTWYGSANAKALLDIVDPMDNLAFEAHMYFDGDGSGKDRDCVNEDVGVQRLTKFTGWLRTNKKRGFLGEFATGTSATCLTALGNVLNFVQTYSDVYMGWAWWGAGPRWGNYMFTLEPDGTGGDRPQMAVLAADLAR